MNIEELSNDDIIDIIECLQVACACRDDCINCPYADKHGLCTLKYIPQEWRPEAIRKKGV